VVYVVKLSKKPLAQIRISPTLVISRQLQDYLLAGVHLEESVVADLPLNNGPCVGVAHLGDCKPEPTNMGRVQVATNKRPTVSEGKMSCAPGATARSIKYLKGDTVGAAQDIYDGLSSAMGTSPTTGTTQENILNGKRKYTKDHK